MLINVTIAIFMMAATTSIHGSGMMLALHLIKARRRKVQEPLKLRPAFWVSVIVIIMFIVSLIEVLLWAVAYLMTGALDRLETAVYFSMVTYTTLGYGDISLGENWRLLSSFEAANGIIMFGWTTAIVMTVIRKAYFHDQPEQGHVA